MQKILQKLPIFNHFCPFYFLHNSPQQKMRQAPSHKAPPHFFSPNFFLSFYAKIVSTPQKVKDWIVQSTANDLLLFRTEPYYYRSLPTEVAKKCFEMSENGATRADITKVMNAGTGMRLGMLEGDFEHGYVSVGNGISAIDRVKSVQELVDELMG